MTDLYAAYQKRLAKGDIHPDPAQIGALTVLQDLANRLEHYTPRASSWLGRLLGKKTTGPRGLYLHGAVGRGKTMLMDLFVDSVPVTAKRRVHFHQFMLEIHERLHRLQKDETPDLLPRVAAEIAAQTWLLCFDEFHVGNIADAMILGRLFESLFAQGVVVVATSNWQPQDLYKNGLQRDSFLPFIDLIQQRMEVHSLNGTIDHRFEHAQGRQHYFSPLNAENTQKLLDIFTALVDGTHPKALDLPVQGRRLHLTMTARETALLTFAELCEAPLAAADYLALAESMHAVIIDGVPVMHEEKRNKTTRFINLIDALYEAKVKLYFASERPIDQLAPKGELAFPFARTVSRLVEMQGDDYMKKAHLSGS